MGKAGHQIEPVGMLKSENRLLADIIINENRPRLLKKRRSRETGSTKRILARIYFEGEPAGRADRPINEV